MGDPKAPPGTTTIPAASMAAAVAATMPLKPPNPASAPARKPVSLIQPSQKNKKQKSSTKVVRVFRSVFRSLPIMTPICKLPNLHGMGFPDSHHHGHHRSNTSSSGTKVTGTLFGYRKGRVSLSIQEAPKCLPSLVVELAMQTSVLQREMSSGMVRIALESEKRAERDHGQKVRLLDEPVWTMYCNGRKSGYGVKRDATEEDLSVMEVLRMVSMGAGVLPGKSEVEGPDGELAYIRAHFEHVVGSKDSETFYMLSPEGNNGPELSIFFVRV